jgi:two-component system response regulator AtoC
MGRLMRSESGKKSSGGVRDSAERRARVLVVDDAEGIRGYLANFLELQGYAVDTAQDGRSALALLEGGAAPDAVILDVMMPGIDGVETLRRIRELEDQVPVIMLSVVGKTSTIVEAMQLGASDYLNKPFEEEELLESLGRVLHGTGGAEGADGGEAEEDLEAALWSSVPMQEISEVLEQIADTNITVLIQGESGVGKEVVARRVCATSSRASEPFVKVNCAALPEDLLESELFGYEKGAFTGANSRKLGKFETAHKGTIFLDEIGEMSPSLQGKLLQVLQDSEFTRLGGNKEVKVDVRVVCATNRPLLEMVERGTFREDLFFRLNVVNLLIPPLRERRDEIADLVHRFVRRYSAAYHRPARDPSVPLMNAFSRYLFPGNVRELENMIKRIVVLESEESVLSELNRFEVGERRSRDGFQTLLEEIEETAGDVPLREVGRRAAMEIEREAIDQTLRRTGWNRKQAAKLLNVSYKTLLLKIRECGLEAEV